MYFSSLRVSLKAVRAVMAASVSERPENCDGITGFVSNGVDAVATATIALPHLLLRNLT